MSESSSSPSPVSNPYQVTAPLQKPDSSFHAGVRPFGLTVIIVLAIVIGGAGIFTSLSSALGLIVNLFFADMFAGMEDTPEGKMQIEMQAVMGSFAIVNWMLAIVGGALSASMLIGGIGLARSKRWASDWLGKVFVAAIGFELIRLAFSTLLQLQTLPITLRMLEQQAAASNGPDMVGMMKVFMWIGIGFWTAFTLSKCGLYFWGKHYVTRPEVSEFLAAKNGPEA